MIYLKYVLSVILFCSSSYSLENINIKNEINLSEIFSNNKFHPTSFYISTTGIYFLDSANRQVAFLSNDNDVVFAGGYGIDNDSFIDPIGILNSKLRVWIIDRTENKLIEFDYKLNYLRTKEFDRIYPEFCGIDDWGNILLLSEQKQKILKATPPIENFDDFIDLSIWNDLYDCISDVHIASDGTIGILSNCSNSVHLFNRLGKLEHKILMEENVGEFLIKLSDEWFVVNSRGQINSLHNDVKIDLQLEQNILDVGQMNGNIYIMVTDKMMVVDVSME